MAKNFSDLMETNENSVLVIDALNLAFRWKHSGAKTFSQEYQNTVRSLAKSYKCEKVIIAADWGSSSYRRQISPIYKGNRQALRDKQTEEEAQAFVDFIEEYNRTLEELSWDYTVLKYKNVEADDIAGFLVKYMEDFGFEQIWLVSSDKDWDLLIQDGVSRFSYVTRKEVTMETWPYDVDQDMYLTYKCLTGDAGDNVLGVPGIGPKRAVQVIDQYGDVFDIYNSIPLPGKQKFIQNLNEFNEGLLLNVELMDLREYCDTAIGEDNCKDIREKLV